jgi:hypothetical protein
MSRSTIKSLLLLLLVMVLFYWKILLTGQFSLLTESEGVNQGYSWYQFWITAVRQGIWPLWDPYTFSGHIFAGEMQTAAFYPLNFLLALVPFNQHGVLSPKVYHEFFAFAHFLAACFMFGLVRELGLSRFSALLGAIGFSLGGFVGRVPWPHLLQSSIWLPLIFLFLLRALKAESLRGALLSASLGGLGLGMAVLAGGLHAVFMQALAIVAAAAWFAFSQRAKKKWPWVRAASVVAVIAGVGLAAGAIQLFPSMEYSREALRGLGKTVLPATQKIPYAYLNDGLAPNAFGMFPLFAAFNGNVGVGEVSNPYLGVFPFLLALIGIWKHWGNLWVRYLTGLAVAAFLYSLASYSFLHGLLYAVVPFLWMAREAGRYLYLANFALPILAAFGAEALFSTESASWGSVNQILKWAVIASGAALSVPALFGRPDLNPWISFSLLMFFATYGLFRYVIAGHTSASVRFIAVALILFDLNAFDWTARNKIDVARTGTDQLERLLSCRGAAAFLKSRPGLFRVQVLADAAPNVGHVFGVQTILGAGVTLLMDYSRFIGGAHAVDLLNVQYLLKPASAQEPGALYQDAGWKVYENPQAYPRAWLVHESMVEPSSDKLFERLGAPEADPHRVALFSAPLDAELEPMPEGAQEEVRFDLYQANRLELKVRAGSRGLLVLSEIYYPGWQASVNGRPARIYKVDGALRGIVVPAGESRLTLRYMPRSILVGGVLTLLAFSGTLLALVLDQRSQ